MGMSSSQMFVLRCLSWKQEDPTGGQFVVQPLLHEQYKRAKEIIHHRMEILRDKHYPDIVRWYEEEIIPFVDGKNREIIVAFGLNGEVLGFSILNLVKGRINVLIVEKPEERVRGIGTRLFEESEFLMGDPHPEFLVPVNAEDSHVYIRMLEKRQYLFRGDVLDKYRIGDRHLIYGGTKKSPQAEDPAQMKML